jgi:hypothetical protein
MLGTTAISETRARLLASFLVVTLLVCHGFFGAFHELSGSTSAGGEPVASASHAAGGMPGHGGGESGTGLPGHLGAADYAAVIVLLLTGAALSLPRVARPVRLLRAVDRSAQAPRPPRLSSIFARGADPPFSQVFRL